MIFGYPNDQNVTCLNNNRKFLNNAYMRHGLVEMYPVIERLYKSGLMGLTLVELRSTDRAHETVYHCRAKNKESYEHPIRFLIDAMVFPEDAEIQVTLYRGGKPEESKWFGHQFEIPGLHMEIMLFNPNYCGGSVKVAFPHSIY